LSSKNQTAKVVKIMSTNRIRSMGEGITFTKDGEVIGNLSPTKRRFRADLAHLEADGLPTFQKLIKRSKGDEVPYSKPANILKRSVYEIGRQIIDQNGGRRLADFMHRSWDEDELKWVGKSAPDPDANPFFWCYHLLHSAKLGVTGDQRSKSSRQLIYAYKNDIPSHLVIGFILQVGGDPILDLYSKQDWVGWRSAKKASKQKNASSVPDLR